MNFNKNITEEEAIEIAKKEMPQAIHECVMANFKKEGKVGILSYIELKEPTIKEVKIDDIEYYEITFLKGDLSWQQLSSDYKKVEIYFDGGIYDDILAKCLISKKKGEFEYTGICGIGL